MKTGFYRTIIRMRNYANDNPRFERIVMTSGIILFALLVADAALLIVGTIMR